MEPTSLQYLIDSNVLLRTVEKGHPHHNAAVEAVSSLLVAKTTLCVVPQNLVEFWAVATRPTTARGLGLKPSQATKHITEFKASLVFLPETMAIFVEWERIVSMYAVEGKQAHDAKLVAAMKSHSLTHLLTFNTTDFRRYEAGENIEVIDPVVLVNNL